MNQARLFVISAIAAALLLLLAGFRMIALIRADVVGQSDGIAIFNLSVDIVIGLFTVLGLFWAARQFAEFAIKPAIRFLPGKADHPFRPANPGLRHPLMRQPPFEMPGWYEEHSPEWPRLPHVVCGVYLENEKPRAGRYVRMVVRMLADPAPYECRLYYVQSKLYNTAQEDPDTGELTLAVQLNEHLVVYQSPLYTGALLIRWRPELRDDELPDKLVLEYDVYTLDGASHGQVLLSVEWKHWPRRR